MAGETVTDHYKAMPEDKLATEKQRLEGEIYVRTYMIRAIEKEQRRRASVRRFTPKEQPSA